MVNKGVYTLILYTPKKSNIDTKNDPFETQTQKKTIGSTPKPSKMWQKKGLVPNLQA